jgi:hypothetical protein
MPNNSQSDIPKAEFLIVTRASRAWIPELIAAAGPEVTESATSCANASRIVDRPGAHGRTIGGCLALKY